MTTKLTSACTILGCLLTLALTGEAAAQQGGERQPGTRSAFCRSIDDVLARLPGGAERFPHKTGQPSTSSEKQSLIPPFDTMYYERGSGSYMGRFYGPLNAGGRVGIEITEAVAACMQGYVISEQELRNREQERWSISFRNSEGLGDISKPSFSVKVNDAGLVSMEIWQLTPPAVAERNRARAAYEKKYRDAGCGVGDDLCVARRAISR